jgi:DNA primase
VGLKRSGSTYKACCPFHNEKTPSFVVSEQKQIFTCFGCGAKGDVIEFIQKYYNLTFPEAVERLANQYGIPIERDYSEGEKKKDGYYEINRIAARYFYDAFTTKANRGYTYMKGRGIEPATLKKFGIGYADAEWQSLTDYLLGQKCDEKMMREIEIVSEKKGRIYDRFRDRVMFPIINTRGKVIGFGGRIIGDGEPKYLNSSESLIFQKKNNLYGLNITRSEIQKEGCAIVVEGYMDVIGLYQGGVKNAVASLGTALTEEQARLLKRYTDSAVLCYDADKAGINATLRGIDVLRGAGLDIKVLHVDDGKAPDEYIKKHGREEFLELIRTKAVADIEYKIQLLRNSYDLSDTAQSVKFFRECARILKGLEPAEQDVYVRKVSAECGISEGALRLQIEQGAEQKDGRRPKVRNEGAEEAEDLSSGRAPEDRSGKREDEPHRGKPDPGQIFMERTLIRLALLNSDYFARLEGHPEVFVTEYGIAVREAMAAQYKPGAELDMNSLKDSLDEGPWLYLRDIRENVQIGEDDRAVFEDCIERLEEAKKKRRIKEITDILSLADAASADDEKIKALMEEIKQLNSN